MGLPTAPCGEDFDTVLDAKIGFFDLNNEADYDEFAPNIDFDSPAPTNATSSKVARRVAKRG